ncbi:hypothetical protein [Gynuella sp.]|uniref:hypothetical protein n=1 Tax=Gynuella sp. TaxID=2969146 RepID=UPI003D0CE4CC
MKIIKKIANRSDLSRLYAMCFLWLFLFILASVIALTSFSAESSLLFAICLIGWVLSILLIKLHDGYNNKIPKGIAKEIILLFFLILLMLFNLILSVSSYYYGNNIFGVFTLALSVFVFIIPSWKSRYLYLIFSLILGGGLIEFHSTPKNYRYVPGLENKVNTMK